MPGEGDFVGGQRVGFVDQVGDLAFELQRFGGQRLGGFDGSRMLVAEVFERGGRERVFLTADFSDLGRDGIGILGSPPLHAALGLLDYGWLFLPLFLPRSSIAPPKRELFMPKSILHVAEILEWADEHRARTGRFPTAVSGRVAVKRDEKWVNINRALQIGLRGLPGNWTLPQLLAEHRGYRNRQRLPKYSLSAILKWADAHHRRTGRWPTRESGPIAEAPGETWTAVKMALFRGRRGLPGGSSLAKLLADRRSVRHRLSPPKLSISRILRWADAERARTGLWPTKAGGPIHESPEENWPAVDYALRKGTRGLPGGSSLGRLLLDHRGVGRHVRRAPFSLKQILQWADAHKRRTGQWPKEISGPIPEAAGETWLMVQAALNDGKRGLPTGWSLAKLLAKHRGVRNLQDLPRFSLRLIRSWIGRHHRRTGQFPTRESGAIADTPGETWGAVENALKAGRRGLPGGSSLAKIVAAFRARHVREVRTAHRAGGSKVPANRQLGGRRR